MEVRPTVQFGKSRYCLCCGEELTGSAEIEPPPIRDMLLISVTITMCECCGHIMAFTDDGLRELDDKEQKRATGDPRIAFASHVIAEAKKSKLS